MMIPPLVLHASGACSLILAVWVISLAWRGRVELTPFERGIVAIAFMAGFYDAFAVAYLVLENGQAVIGRRRNDVWGLILTQMAIWPVALALLAMKLRQDKLTGADPVGPPPA